MDNSSSVKRRKAPSGKWTKRGEPADYESCRFSFLNINNTYFLLYSMPAARTAATTKASASALIAASVG